MKNMLMQEKHNKYPYYYDTFIRSAKDDVLEASERSIHNSFKLEPILKSNFKAETISKTKGEFVIRIYGSPPYIRSKYESSRNAAKKISFRLYLRKVGVEITYSPLFKALEGV